MNKFAKLVMTALFVPLFVLTLQAQKSVSLKYNLTEGDRYNYVMDMDQDVVFEANGQPMALDQQMTFTMIQEIVEVNSDSIRIDGQIKRVKMVQGIFGMSVTYDSDDPSTAENPMTAKIAEEFSKVLNKSFFMAMDHQGNLGNMDLTGVTESDDLANNLNSGSQFASYPEGKVSVGDTWEKEISPVEGSDMQFHAKYTLLKLSGKQATLSLEGTITANKLSESDLKMNGTMKGEMIVDVNTGWLIESTVDQDLELDIEQNGMKFPATINGTTVTTSSKIN